MDGLSGATRQLQNGLSSLLDFLVAANIVGAATEPAKRRIIVVRSRIANAIFILLLIIFIFYLIFLKFSY